MNRRSFFTAITGASAAAGTALAARPPTGLPDRFRWNGWDIRWTGWKDLPNQDVLCAQWLARPIKANGKHDPTRHFVYSSTPGYAGVYELGDSFNVAWRKRDDQPLVMHDTPEPVREQAKLLALRDLLQCITAGAKCAGCRNCYPDGERYVAVISESREHFERWCQDRRKAADPRARYREQFLYVAPNSYSWLGHEVNEIVTAGDPLRIPGFHEIRQRLWFALRGRRGLNS